MLFKKHSKCGLSVYFVSDGLILGFHKRRAALIKVIKVKVKLVIIHFRYLLCEFLF